MSNKINKAFGAVICATLLAFSANALITKESKAGCYFVACPNSQPQAEPIQYQEAPIVDNYQQGYNDGLRAGHRVIVKKVYINKAYKAKSKAKAKAKAHVKHRKIVAKHINKKVYKVAQTKRHITYSQPYIDHASQYNADNYGQVINIANYGGRGESWVSSYGTRVRLCCATSCFLCQWAILWMGRTNKCAKCTANMGLQL